VYGSHDATRRFFGSLPLWCSFLNFAYTDLEYSGNVDVIAGRGFNKCATKIPCRPFAVLGRDLSLLYIVFSADDDAWDSLFSDKVSDLVINDFDHVEGLSRGNRVDEDVAVDANCIFRIQNGEFILASSIDDIAVVLLALCLDRLCKGVFDGRVIVFDKVVFSKLYDEGGLSNRTGAQDGDLSLVEDGETVGGVGGGRHGLG